MKKVFDLFLGVLIVVLGSTVFSWAEDDVNKIESRHFTVEYKSGVDLKTLDDNLKVSDIDQQLTNLKVDHSSLEKELASKLEVLFNRASDILDMRVYNYKGHIKVSADQAASLYSIKDDSIYVSAVNFRREILGHEMGHAIMSHYFAILPSINTQEILTGYIEYQLRKSK